MPREEQDPENRVDQRRDDERTQHGGPVAARGPNIFQNVMRCIDIMTAERAVRDCLLADVVIRPRFVQTGWKHFDQADAYAAAGEACRANPACTRITVWGMADHLSWLGADQRALTFDEGLAPKPAWQSLRGG